MARSTAELATTRAGAEGQDRTPVDSASAKQDGRRDSLDDECGGERQQAHGGALPGAEDGQPHADLDVTEAEAAGQDREEQEGGGDRRDGDGRAQQTMWVVVDRSQCDDGQCADGRARQDDDVG